MLIYTNNLVQDLRSGDDQDEITRQIKVDPDTSGKLSLSENNFTLGFAFASGYVADLTLPSRIGKFKATLFQNIGFRRVSSRELPIIPMNVTH